MTVAQSKKLKVFYSYSHKDKEYRDQLESHLSNLRRLYNLQNWFDRQIHAGDNWEEVLEEHLNTADLIFLLISPDFMHSDYCYNKEMTRALERHARGEAKVIPIIVRHVHWNNAPFSHIQLLPTGARPIKSWIDPDEAFYDVVLEVEKAIQDLLRLRGNIAQPEERGAFHGSGNEEDILDFDLDPIEDLGHQENAGLSDITAVNSTNDKASKRAEKQTANPRNKQARRTSSNTRYSPRAPRINQDINEYDEPLPKPLEKPVQSSRRSSQSLTPLEKPVQSSRRSSQSLTPLEKPVQSSRRSSQSLTPLEKPGQSSRRSSQSLTPLEKPGQSSRRSSQSLTPLYPRARRNVNYDNDDKPVVFPTEPAPIDPRATRPLMPLYPRAGRNINIYDNDDEPVIFPAEPGSTNQRVSQKLRPMPINQRTSQKLRPMPMNQRDSQSLKPLYPRASRNMYDDNDEPAIILSRSIQANQRAPQFLKLRDQLLFLFQPELAFEGLSTFDTLISSNLGISAKIVYKVRITLLCSLAFTLLILAILGVIGYQLNILIYVFNIVFLVLTYSISVFQ